MATDEPLYQIGICPNSIDETIKPEIAEIADELFRLLVQYIYKIPHKLNNLKQETQTLELKAKGSA